MVSTRGASSSPRSLTPHPSSLLSPYRVISQTLSHFVRHRWMRFALPKHFEGCQATPNASFPPSHSCSWLYLSLFSHIEGEIGRGRGGGNVRPPSDMIGICKRQQMLHGFRCFALAANCFIIINCPADWNCGQRADDTERGREMWGGEGRAMQMQTLRNNTVTKWGKTWVGNLSL